LIVKIAKIEHEFFNIFLQCSNILVSSVFIELSNSSLGDDLTHDGSLMRLLITIFQCIILHLPQPSNPTSKIQFIIFCFYAMVLPRHTPNELQNSQHLI